MGVTKERALATPLSAATRRIVERMYALIRCPQDHYDLRVLITLRVTGEVLVAEQYRHVVAEMDRRFGITPAQSRFYYPHYAHDRKGAKGVGHTGAFDALLALLITDDRTLKIATETAEEAFQIRYRFHSQFLPRRQLVQAGMRLTRWLAAAAAVTLVAVMGHSTLRLGTVASELQQERGRRQFLEGQVDANAWLRECDRELVAWFRKTGDSRWLAAVGTPNGPRELYGEGP